MVNLSPTWHAKYKGFNMVYLNLFVKYVNPHVSGSTVIQVKEDHLNSEFDYIVEDALYEKLKESLQIPERVVIENIVILGRCEKDDYSLDL